MAVLYSDIRLVSGTYKYICFYIFSRLRRASACLMLGGCLDTGQSTAAPTARDIKARGQARSASPLGNRIKSHVALKGRNTPVIFRPFRPWSPRGYRNQGRRAPLRLRLPLTFIFRLLGLIATRGRRAPLCFALAPGFHIPRLWRSVY